MSYILDALKKSDQERKQGEVPGLHSLQGQPRQQIATSRVMLYALIGVLVVNVLVIGFWLAFRQENAANPTAEVPGKSSLVADDAEKGKGAVEPPEAAKAKTPAPDPADFPGRDKQSGDYPAAETGVTIINDDIAVIDDEILSAEETDDSVADLDSIPYLVRFERLPAEIRTDLPDLSIAAHYYAGKPSSRMASINGRIMREGQTISDGLLLEEITREGVIFRFRNYRFSMDVFIR